LGFLVERPTAVGRWIQGRWLGFQQNKHPDPLYIVLKGHQENVEIKILKYTLL